MLSPATLQKRHALSTFSRTVLEPHPAVQAVIGIGSLADGTAQPDSDVDAILFLEPYDTSIVPAEFVWLPSSGAILAEAVEGAVAFDLTRLDLVQWADPAFEWEEGYRAALAGGWPAFDREGQVGRLIAERTAYPDVLRTQRLDEALTWLEKRLKPGEPEMRWERSGPLIAHDRLSEAYEFLVGALFALNQHWRPWRGREISTLLRLDWLPPRFSSRVMTVLNAPSQGYEGYMQRTNALRALYVDLQTEIASRAG